jgi:hypothetical protein
MHTGFLGRLVALCAICALALSALSAVPTQAQERETLILALLSSGAESDVVSSRHFVQGAQLALEIVNGGGGAADHVALRAATPFTLSACRRAALLHKLRCAQPCKPLWKPSLLR